MDNLKEHEELLVKHAELENKYTQVKKENKYLLMDLVRTNDLFEIIKRDEEYLYDDILSIQDVISENRAMLSIVNKKLDMLLKDKNIQPEPKNE